MKNMPTEVLNIKMFMVQKSCTMEHVRSTDDLATQNGDIPVRKLLVDQRL